MEIVLDSSTWSELISKAKPNPGGCLGLIFARYVPLASQSFYPIIVYSVVNYRPHLCHFSANM